MPGRSPCAVWLTTLMPTVVSNPSSRKRRPSAIESLTEPPLESSTTVAPRSSRPCAKSSKSFGLSAVTMPTALTQPRQLGSQATQLNFIGSLRSSRTPPACAPTPIDATTASETTPNIEMPSILKMRKSGNPTSLKPNPSYAPSPKPEVQSLKSKVSNHAAIGPTRWFQHAGVAKMLSGRLPIVHSDLLRRYQWADNIGKVWRNCLMPTVPCPGTHSGAGVL